MSVSLTVAAVVAGDAGLDDARVAHIDEREVHRVTGVNLRTRGGTVTLRRAEWLRRSRRSREMTRDGVSHEGPQFLVGHWSPSGPGMPGPYTFSIVTRSTMPMIAASTGATFRP